MSFTESFENEAEVLKVIKRRADVTFLLLLIVPFVDSLDLS